MSSREAKAKCDKCGEIGHFKKNCIKCSNCSKNGHISRNCPNVICGFCDVKGHRSIDCPSDKMTIVELSENYSHFYCMLCKTKDHINSLCPFQNKKIVNEKEVLDFLKIHSNYVNFTATITDLMLIPDFYKDKQKEIVCRFSYTGNSRININSLCNIECRGSSSIFFLNVLQKCTYENLFEYLSKYNVFTKLKCLFQNIKINNLLNDLRQHQIIDYKESQEDKRGGSDCVTFSKIDDIICSHDEYDRMYRGRSCILCKRYFLYHLPNDILNKLYSLYTTLKAISVNEVKNQLGYNMEIDIIYEK